MLLYDLVIAQPLAQRLASVGVPQDACWHWLERLDGGGWELAEGFDWEAIPNTSPFAPYYTTHYAAFTLRELMDLLRRIVHLEAIHLSGKCGCSAQLPWHAEIRQPLTRYDAHGTTPEQAMGELLRLVWTDTSW